MKVIHIVKWIFLIAIVLFVLPVGAEDSDRPSDITALWVNAGFGRGNPEYASCMDLNFQFRHPVLYQISCVHNDNKKPNIINWGDPTTSVSALSISVGAWKKFEKITGAF